MQSSFSSMLFLSLVLAIVATCCDATTTPDSGEGHRVNSKTPRASVGVVHSFGESTVEQLAAKEVTRYWSILTGRRPTLQFHKDRQEQAFDLDLDLDFATSVSLGNGVDVETVVLVTQGHPILDHLRQSYPVVESVLNSPGFRNARDITTKGNGRGRNTHDAFALQYLQSDQTTGVERNHTGNGTSTVVCLLGSTPTGTLYAAYELLNRMGVYFAIDGDAFPNENPALRLPNLAGGSGILAVPTFADRGLQPFHDFPMGPDWWQLEFWKALQSQMAKLHMNFLGFHTYPVGPIVEPAVWIGKVGGYDALGSINVGTGSYESSWYLTQNFDVAGTNTTRGNVPGQKSTAASTFCCGGALAFPRDCYGSDAQKDICFPRTPQQAAAVFDNSAELLRDAFAWGSMSSGVRTALGVEVPLTGPDGQAPTDPAELRELYDGVFGRIVAANVPIERFWLWTSENVEDHTTGKGYPQSNPLWARLIAEFKVALASLAATPGANFSLGTNGWCLGPGDNASFFDKAISDPTFGIGAINGALGWLPPDPAYIQVASERATVIPWMEDDLALNSLELWVNRTLSHAQLATTYGVTGGLLGLLWRTFETSPQISALARAGWNFSSTATGQRVDIPLTVSIVYEDFCAGNFGQDTAATCAKLFNALDSAPADAKQPNSRLPRVGQMCCGGPFGPAAVSPGTNEVAGLADFEAWLKTVSGAANIERATRWLNVLRYTQQTVVVTNASFYLAQQVAGPLSKSSAQALLPQALSFRDEYHKMITYLLGALGSPGELGMLAAHEGGNWQSFLGEQSMRKIAAALAECGPDPTVPPQCFEDSNTQRIMPFTVTLRDNSMTQEQCAGACLAENFTVFGVEFGVACFCAPDDWPQGANATKLPESSCQAMHCEGDPTEWCGGADTLLVRHSHCNGTAGTPAQILAELSPNSTYLGAPRIFRPAIRTAVSRSETMFHLEVTVLSNDAPSRVVLTVNSLSTRTPASNMELMEHGHDDQVEFSQAGVWSVAEQVDMTQSAAGVQGERGQVFSADVNIPAGDEFSYFVEAQWDASTSASDGGGGTSNSGNSGAASALRTPVEGNQTVVIVD